MLWNYLNKKRKKRDRNGQVPEERTPENYL